MKLKDEVTLTRGDVWLIAGNIMLLAALSIQVSWRVRRLEREMTKEG